MFVLCVKQCEELHLYIKWTRKRMLMNDSILIQLRTLFSEPCQKGPLRYQRRPTQPDITSKIKLLKRHESHKTNMFVKCLTYTLSLP